MNLYRYKSTLFDYYTDDEGRYQGEYKEYWSLGRRLLQEHCFYVNDDKHGEFIFYNVDGSLEIRSLYINGKLYDTPVDKITPEDKLLLTIKYNLRWIE